MHCVVQYGKLNSERQNRGCSHVSVTRLVIAWDDVHLLLRSEGYSDRRVCITTKDGAGLGLEKTGPGSLRSTVPLSRFHDLILAHLLASTFQLWRYAMGAANARSNPSALRSRGAMRIRGYTTFTTPTISTPLLCADNDTAPSRVRDTLFLLPYLHLRGPPVCPPRVHQPTTACIVHVACRSSHGLSTLRNLKPNEPLSDSQSIGTSGPHLVKWESSL